jgi:hypothetical protein
MPRVDRGLGPLRPISYTASEIMARQIVNRLCQHGRSAARFASSRRHTPARRRLTAAH